MREQLDRTGSGRTGRAAGRVCPSAESRINTGLEGGRTDWTGTFSYFFKEMDIGIREIRERYIELAKFPVQSVRDPFRQIAVRLSADGYVRPAARPLPVRGGVAL